MQANLGMPDHDSDYTYAYHITEEISSFRQSIRHSNYIQKSTLTTLSNKHTDTELLQFSTQAQHNKHHITVTSLFTNYHPDKITHPFSF